MKHQNKSLWQQLLIIPVIVLIFCTISTAPAQTAPQIAEKTLAATVYLEMQDSKGLPLGFGSGFFVRDNLIATNYHVIEGAARGTAKLVGKFTTYTIEGVTATDKTNDLALLKVTAPGIKPLPLGNSTDVKIGETVYVAGNPKGLEGTFSNGIISSRRDKNTKERLQMTAPISPGSSGGPVLNSKGEVIGVSFMTLVGGQNLNFAIPSRYLTELLTLNLNQRNLWHKAIALYLPKPTSCGGIRSLIWVIIRVLSQTIPRLSASILIMPMHTTIAEMRRPRSILRRHRRL